MLKFRWVTWAWRSYARKIPPVHSGEQTDCSSLSILIIGPYQLLSLLTNSTNSSQEVWSFIFIIFMMQCKYITVCVHCTNALYMSQQCQPDLQDHWRRRRCRSHSQILIQIWVSINFNQDLWSNLFKIGLKFKFVSKIMFVVKDNGAFLQDLRPMAMFRSRWWGSARNFEA